MKNIEEYIIEQEYQEYFLIEEGFWSWIKKLGKKFWEWLTDKDYTDESIDWNIGKSKKLQWAKGDETYIKKLRKNKGLKDNFPKTTRIIEDDDAVDIDPYAALNKDKIPVIHMLTSTNKKKIHSIMRKSKKYEIYKNKIDAVNNPIILINIEVAKNNNDNTEVLFDNYILDKINKDLIHKYDVVFLDSRNLKNYMSLLSYEYGFEEKFPVIDGKVEWDNVSDEPDSGSEEIPNPDNAKVNIETNDDEGKNVPENIIEFIDDKEVIASAEFTKDQKTIKNIIQMEVNSDYNNFLVTELTFNDKFKVDDYADIMRYYIIPVICDNFVQKVGTIDLSKEIKIYIKLDEKKYANHIKQFKKLSDLSTSEKVRFKESINNLFIIIGKSSSEIKAKEKEIIESLDIDNLFWMIDTWFSNNEQERSLFLSIIDNCIIKKTYNKNDLSKLCDNCNFDVRPFINFMSKDAVKNNQEDNTDYYYELKKIIDALISNKATNNKYVRYS